MKFIILYVISSIGLSNAFAPTFFPRKSFISTKISASNDEVEALLAQAAKLREESEAAERAMGKEPTSQATVAAPPPQPKSLTFKEALTALGDLDVSSATSLSAMPKFSRSPIPLTPFPTNLKTLESRTSGKITGASLGIDGSDDVSLEDFKYATIAVTLISSILAVGAGIAFPNNTGATLTYMFAIIPVLWIAVGSSAPGILAGLIETVRSTKEDKDTKRKRVIAHEAAHLICGYYAGLPVVDYKVEDGEPRVEFGLPDTKNLPFTEVSKLSVVAMAGSVGEVAGGFETAKGGEGDLMVLQGAMSGCEEFLGAAKQQDMTRWGALMSYNLVTGNKKAFDRVREGMEKGKDVKELIACIEGGEE